jgi:hypothetical protein
VIEVGRLRAESRLFGEVFRWHWFEWGVATANADERRWRAQLAGRCLDTGIPFTLVASIDGEPVGCVFGL